MKSRRLDHRFLTPLFGIESIPFFGWSHRLIVYLITSRQMTVRRNAYRAPPACANEARSPLHSSKDDTRHEQSEA